VTKLFSGFGQDDIAMSITDEQRSRLENLHSAMVNDITDEMGIDDNVIPCTDIRSLWSREPTVGVAYTSQMVEIGYEEEREPDPRDSPDLQYLDGIDEGDFVVRAAPDGTRAGMWGELLSTIAQVKGGVGALIEGPTRDSRMIEEHGFPVWCTGHSSLESFGRVSYREADVPVEIEGVRIEPGDVVFADYESIAIIPPDLVDEVIERGEAEMETEDEVREEIRAGRDIFEIWEEYETL
jgi:regulator of RNase E activity RraA